MAQPLECFFATPRFSGNSPAPATWARRPARQRSPQRYLGIRCIAGCMSQAHRASFENSHPWDKGIPFQGNSSRCKRDCRSGQWAWPSHGSSWKRAIAYSKRDQVLQVDELIAKRGGCDCLIQRLFGRFHRFYLCFMGERPFIQDSAIVRVNHPKFVPVVGVNVPKTRQLNTNHKKHNE